MIGHFFVLGLFDYLLTALTNTGSVIYCNLFVVSRACCVRNNKSQHMLYEEVRERPRGRRPEV